MREHEPLQTCRSTWYTLFLFAVSGLVGGDFLLVPLDSHGSFLLLLTGGAVRKDSDVDTVQKLRYVGLGCELVHLRLSGLGRKRRVESVLVYRTLIGHKQAANEAAKDEGDGWNIFRTINLCNRCSRMAPYV